ncbi:MAG: lamin tail domain-containing protein, partial [Polyangiaceae bacterium]|nr:lamin tail domain-containing protein [Polyangiaceae bacterium]
MMNRRLWCLAPSALATTLFACQVYDSSLLPESAPGQPIGGSGRGGAGSGGAGGSGGVGGSGGSGGSQAGAGFGGSGGGSGSSGGSGGSTQGAGGSAGEGIAGASGSGGGAGAGPIVINELYYDGPGADTGSFIELKGPPGASLANYRLQGVNGNSPPGSFYGELAFNTTHIFDANGYFVVAQDDTVSIAAGAAFRINSFANLENGPDNVVLLGPDDAIVDAVGYTGIGGTFAETQTFVGEGKAASGVAAP